MIKFEYCFKKFYEYDEKKEVGFFICISNEFDDIEYNIINCNYKPLKRYRIKFTPEWFDKFECLIKDSKKIMEINSEIFKTDCNDYLYYFYVETDDWNRSVVCHDIFKNSNDNLLKQEKILDDLFKKISFLLKELNVCLKFNKIILLQLRFLKKDF